MSNHQSTADTLNSWKEIAAYLDRSVRTVRRWEATEGLPVHRHLHQKASTVFAIRTEIDAWQRERSDRARAESSDSATPAKTTPTTQAPPSPAVILATERSNWRQIAATVALVVAGSVLGWMSHGWLADSRPTGIANNANGDTGSVLERALENDILRSAVSLCSQYPSNSECLMLRENVAQLRPQDFDSNYQAAFAFAARAGDLGRARPYAEQARALLDEQLVSENSAEAAWLLLFDSRAHWGAGNAKAALASARELESTVANWPPRLRTLLARDFGNLALSLGRLEEARHWFQQIADYDLRREMIAWYLFAAGRPDELTELLKEDLDFREPFTAVLLAMTGSPERARALVDSLDPGRVGDDVRRLADGVVRFFDGDRQEAVSIFESTLVEMDDSGDPIFFAASDMLAMARHAAGDVHGAIDALEMTSRQRDRAMFSSAGLLWLKCQSRLSSYYAEAGRPREQERVDAALGRRLETADPGFPVLVDINARTTSS